MMFREGGKTEKKEQYFDIHLYKYDLSYPSFSIHIQHPIFETYFFCNQRIIYELLIMNFVWSCMYIIIVVIYIYVCMHILNDMMMII